MFPLCLMKQIMTLAFLLGGCGEVLPSPYEPPQLYYDMNGDGKQDGIFVRTAPWNGKSLFKRYIITLQLSNPDGTFQAEKTIADMGIQPLRIGLRDIDRDEDMDIEYIIRESGLPVRYCLFNDGQGNFAKYRCNHGTQE